jgi:uncharacterized protein GlcG (DUF336 family)
MTQWRRWRLNEKQSREDVAMLKINLAAMLVCAPAVAIGLAAPGGAQGVLPTHRLSAALAAEAATEAVAACAKQGYGVTATVVDTAGETQAMVRGDGATKIAVLTSYDKAYTVIMLGAARNEDSSGAIAQRIGSNQPPGGLVKEPHILLQQGALRIKLGNEAIAAIGVGGAPGGNFDEGCAKAGIDKIGDRLK